uniref:diphosphoinositol-polyphosphate diphosphatase n=1 Tax=Meloidogyne incognita TaxID=6306 RepID=A0A914LVK1_MELIC
MCTKDNTNSKQNGSSSTSKETEEYPKPSSSKDYNKEAGKAANGDRIRDKDGYRQRAAAFCLRLSSNDGDNQNIIINEFGNIQSVKAPLEVLLVSGRRDGSAENYWVLPGGGVELKESTEEAVVRELREEAGIQGQVLFQIGKFIDDQRFHHTTLYALSVLKTFDEWENCENGRERRWMNLDEARRFVKPNQLAMLEQSIKALDDPDTRKPRYPKISVRISYPDIGISQTPSALVFGYLGGIGVVCPFLFILILGFNSGGLVDLIVLFK